MTVKEVIEALKTFDENKPLLINIFSDDGIDYDEVQEIFDPCGDGTPMII